MTTYVNFFVESHAALWAPMLVSPIFCEVQLLYAIFILTSIRAVMKRSLLIPFHFVATNTIVNVEDDEEDDEEEDENRDGD